MEVSTSREPRFWYCQSTSLARSYSSVAGGAAASSSDKTRPNQPQREKTELQELKDMMQCLLTLTMQTQMEVAVY
jgi:hypothetical protein